MELPTTEMTLARVVELMSANASNASVLSAGARALAQLLAVEGGDDDEALSHCAAAGAIPLLLRALAILPPNDCAAACLALSHIASTDAQRDACAEAGAIPALWAR